MEQIKIKLSNKSNIVYVNWNTIVTSGSDSEFYITVSADTKINIDDEIVFSQFYYKNNQEKYYDVDNFVSGYTDYRFSGITMNSSGTVREGVGEVYCNAYTYLNESGYSMNTELSEDIEYTQTSAIVFTTKVINILNDNNSHKKVYFNKPSDNQDEKLIPLKKDEKNYSGYTSQMSVYFNNNFYSVPFFIKNEENPSKVMMENDINEFYNGYILNNIIPGFYNLEKVKVSPYYEKNNLEKTVSALVFNFNFRKRHEERASWDFSGYTWNNGKNTYSPSSSTTKSDLLGRLRFVDEDVEYSKKKLTKSFIRLSYYETPDLTEKKLLGYATVFLDGGELYGKYVKLKNDKNVKLNNSGQYVDYDGSGTTRLDTQITITNEFDETKCSEGFNLYLFKEDVSFTENEDKTIYMTVEFNHAGNGRTIPFIRPNKNIGSISDFKNYYDALFIPLKIKNINGKPRYSFSDDRIDFNDNKIYIDLYEPILYL